MLEISLTRCPSLLIRATAKLNDFHVEMASFRFSVKPLPPEYLSLTVENSEEVNLRWSMPKGPIPAKCFIYEIEFTEDDTTWVVRTLHLFGKNVNIVFNFF